jgi:hypothetical protein
MEGLQEDWASVKLVDVLCVNYGSNTSVFATSVTTWIIIINSINRVTITKLHLIVRW